MPNIDLPFLAEASGAPSFGRTAPYNPHPVVFRAAAGELNPGGAT
jgi:hypothetical protein